MRLLILTAFISMVSLSSITADEKAPFRVAVVDMLQLLDQYDKSKDLEKQLESEYAKEDEKVKKIREEISAMTAELRIAAEDKANSITRQIKEKEFSIKMTEDSLKESLANKHRRFTQSVYEDIKEMVALQAKELGIQLVLRKSMAKGQSDREIQMEMMNNMIIFHSDEVDLTSVVLKMLNTRYQQMNKEESVK